MTTAYTSLLGLALPVTGELQGTWGDTVNNSITSLLDTAVAGTTTLSTDVDVTLTTTTGASNQARQAIILWTASGTTTRYITAPAQSKIYTVINNSGSTQSIVIRGVGPTTGVTVPKGKAIQVVWNGSDFVELSPNSITGNLTVGGTLTVTGNTALGGATLSNWNAAFKVAEFTGGALLTQGTSQMGLYYNAYYDSAWKYKTGALPASYLTLSSNGGFNFYTGATGTNAGDPITWASRLQQDTTGNIGVSGGSTSVIPAGAGSSYSGIYMPYNMSLFPHNAYTWLTYNMVSNAPNVLKYQASSLAAGAVAIDQSGQIQFYSAPNSGVGGAGTTLTLQSNASIRNNGNAIFGIGADNISPIASLTTYTAASGATATLGLSGTLANATGMLYYNNSGNYGSLLGKGLHILMTNSGNGILFGKSYSDAAYTSGSGTFTEYARFISAGDFIVGAGSTPYTSNNRGMVYVNGATSTMFGLGVGGSNMGYLYSTTTDFQLWSEGTKAMTIGTASAGAIGFTTNNTNRMTIAASSYAVGFSNTSPNYQLDTGYSNNYVMRNDYAGVVYRNSFDKNLAGARVLRFWIYAYGLQFVNIFFDIATHYYNNGGSWQQGRNAVQFMAENTNLRLNQRMTNYEYQGSSSGVYSFPNPPSWTYSGGYWYFDLSIAAGFVSYITVRMEGPGSHDAYVEQIS